MLSPVSPTDETPCCSGRLPLLSWNVSVCTPWHLAFFIQCHVFKGALGVVRSISIPSGCVVSPGWPCRTLCVSVNLLVVGSIHLYESGLRECSRPSLHGHTCALFVGLNLGDIRGRGVGFVRRSSAWMCCLTLPPAVPGVPKSLLSSVWQGLFSHGLLAFPW